MMSGLIANERFASPRGRSQHAHASCLRHRQASTMAIADGLLAVVAVGSETQPTSAEPATVHTTTSQMAPSVMYIRSPSWVIPVARETTASSMVVPHDTSVAPDIVQDMTPPQYMPMNAVATL